MQYRTLGRTEDTLNVARADMRRTEWVKANARPPAMTPPLPST